MIDIPEDSVQVWDRVEQRANTKIREGQSTKWHTHVHIYIYKQINMPDFQLCYP